MAVELRCPDCRAKLRLKVAPEAGTEVECPKCGTAFPAPEPEPEPEADAPKKKAEGGDEKPKKKDKKEKKGAGEPQGPKKRKVKKKETSKVALIAVICAGLLLVIAMAVMLAWYFSRTSKAVEMFLYVPEDAQSAWGINVGHVQKYPAFYKSVRSLHDGTGIKAPLDAIAKAAGSDSDTLADYVARAESVKSGGTLVFHTKAEFDGDALAKIPGAAKKTLDGKTYYLADGLLANEPARVFAPTNRLIVVANTSKLNEAVFKKMLGGHADGKEKTLGVRMGALGKRVTRGTYWQLTLFGPEVSIETILPPAEPPGPTGKAAQDSDQARRRAFYKDALNGAQGVGVKASLGSREIRLEMVAWHTDTEKPAAAYKKLKEGDLGKGDEGTPPRWFTDDVGKFGDRKIGTQLTSNIGFASDGELLVAKSAATTADLQYAAGNLLGKVLGAGAKASDGIMGPAPTGAPGGGTAPAPGGPAKAPRRRRYDRACR